MNYSAASVALPKSNPGDVAPSRAWAAVVLFSALYVVSFVDRLILALLVEPIKADLGISDVQVGLLIGTSFAIVFSVAGLPLARLADNGNRVRLIFIGALAWGLSTAAAAYTQSFASLLLLRIGVALGEAALTPAVMSLLSDMFPPHKRALPISIYVMVGVCGGAGAMLIGAGALQFVASNHGVLPLLGAMSAWRLTLILVGLPAIVLALLVPLVVPNVARSAHEPQTSEKRGALAGYHSTHARTYLGFYLITGMVSAVNFSILTWFPSHLIRSFHVSATEAGYSFGMIGVAGSLVGGLLLPFIARRMNNRGTFEAPIVIAAAVSCVSSPLLILSLLAPTAHLSILAIVIPFTLQTGLGILMAATAPLLAPPSIRAQMVACYYLVLTLVGLGAGPTLVAWLAEHAAWAGGNVGYALAGLILVFAPLQFIVAIGTRRAFKSTYAHANPGLSG